MGREILFRGKRADNGKWIEGYFVKYQSCSIIKDDIKDEWIIGIVPNYARAFYLIEVIPSTVGKYTGLTDRNGVKIFEGDILRETRYGTITFVKWNSGCFWLDKFYDNIGSAMIDHHFEVIGNIHDNPDLLGGDTNDS